MIDIVAIGGLRATCDKVLKEGRRPALQVSGDATQAEETGRAVPSMAQE